MNEAASFRESLERILSIGIEHTDKHCEDLRRLAMEASAKHSKELSQGLLEAAKLAEALALKLREMAAKVE